MDNTDFTLHWRKRVAAEFVTYALREVRGDDMSEARRRVARHESAALALGLDGRRGLADAQNRRFFEVQVLGPGQGARELLRELGRLLAPDHLGVRAPAIDPATARRRAVHHAPGMADTASRPARPDLAVLVALVL